MKHHTLSVEIPFDYYTPRSVIVGIRRADMHAKQNPDALLAGLHADMPGWGTLALVGHRPVRFSRSSIPVLVASMPGAYQPDEPLLSRWRP